MATYWENSCSFGLRYVSWYLFFSHLGFWSGNLFLIAPFPDLCLLVPFFTSSDQSRYTLWSCQNVCDALSYLLDNIYIRFGTKLYRQIFGIPMGTNCAPLVADLFYTATIEISWILLTMIIKLLSRLLIPFLGNSMTF